MPIIIHGIKIHPPVRPPRGRGFDAAIRKLAPIIAEFQAAGFLGIQQLADQLNEAGEVAPSGKPFSHGTTWRMLTRLAQLGLAQGPLTSNGSRRHTAKQFCQ